MKHFLTFLYILVNIILGIICFKTSGYITIGGLLFIIMLSSFSFANYIDDDYFEHKYLKPMLCLSPSVTYLFAIFIKLLINIKIFSKVLF